MFKFEEMKLVRYFSSFTHDGTLGGTIIMINDCVAMQLVRKIQSCAIPSLVPLNIALVKVVNGEVAMSIKDLNKLKKM